jgi:uncharacterized protein (TIGR02594 family)
MTKIGIYEIPGPENNPEIVKWLESVNLPGIDKIPHCSAFVNYVVEGDDYLGYKGVPGTKSGMARSWLKWGYEIKEPKLGCIVVIRRGLDPNLGHVGFYMDDSNGFLRILGANQGDRVGINSYAKVRLLGYRWNMMWE